MLHPSYTDLINAVNSGAAESGDEPVVQSRYSIVIATAKRARQIIAGDEPMIAKAYNKKPLSIAVEELYEQNIIIGKAVSQCCEMAFSSNRNKSKKE